MVYGGESLWRIFLCFLGIQKQSQGVAPIPYILFVSTLSLVSGNQAYLRVTKAFLFRALTTHKTPFAISSFLLDPSSTLNSLPAMRFLMFFSKALCSGFWASTDSKPLIFKTSQGAWMLFHGESLLLRICNSPAQDLHILLLFIYLFVFRKWNFFQEKKKKDLFSYWRDKVTSSVLRANSYSGPPCHITCGAVWGSGVWGNGVGTCLPCRVRVTLQPWCPCGKPVAIPSRFKLNKNSATSVSIRNSWTSWINVVFQPPPPSSSCPVLMEHNKQAKPSHHAVTRSQKAKVNPTLLHKWNSNLV